MSLRLKGKTALVTAAAQGIGRATALAFAAEGAQVYATDLNAAKLAEIVGPGIRSMALDVRDTAAVHAAAEAIGAVDILFNCAGFVHQGSVLEATEAEWDFAFDLNGKSMLRTTQAFLPGMLAKGGGRWVHMATVGVPGRGSGHPAEYRGGARGGGGGGRGHVPGGGVSRAGFAHHRTQGGGVGHGNHRCFGLGPCTIPEGPAAVGFCRRVRVLALHRHGPRGGGFQTTPLGPEGR